MTASFGLGRVGLRFAVVLGALALGACDGPPGPASSDTAMLLARYYRVLAEATIQSWEQQAAYNALLGVPTSERVERAYEERLSALKARASMASELASAATALAASQDVGAAQRAGERLGQALANVPRLPGAGTMPSALGSTATLLARFAGRPGKKNAAEAIGATQRAVGELFAVEEQAYLSIARERGNSATNLLRLLADKQLVTTAPLLQRLQLGGQWTTKTAPEAPAAGLAVARVRQRRATLTIECATENTRHAIEHAGLAGYEHARALAGAAACLDEYEQH